jgi:hypothetical protein
VLKLYFAILVQNLQHFGTPGSILSELGDLLGITLPRIAGLVHKVLGPPYLVEQLNGPNQLGGTTVFEYVTDQLGVHRKTHNTSHEGTHHTPARNTNTTCGSPTRKVPKGEQGSSHLRGVTPHSKRIWY